MRRTTDEKTGAQRGAAAIEFALVLPLLIALLFGIVEFSIMLYDKAMITNASREGARRGIVYRQDPATGDYTPLSDGEIASEVDSYLAGRLITFRSATPATTTVGRESPNLRVTVAYRYTFLVLPSFVTTLSGLGGGINLNAQTVMRME